jgi:frataxin-like iron-binding protein CyaY
MNQNKFDSLIDSLVESVKDYNLDSSFDSYNAIIEICDNCDYSFVYFKAWQLVNFVKFDCLDDTLFDEVEREVQDNDHNTDDITLNDYMMTYAFNILKVATLKKYESQVKEVA